MASLVESINDQQMKLLEIKRRLHVLRAFVSDLETVTRGKPFRIWDDLAWMMVLDSRDALVIHLASFAKGLHRHHLADIVHPHLKKLRRSPKREEGEVVDEYDPSVNSYADAFQRLFPACTKKSPGKSDIAALRDRLRVRVDLLRQDRNQNRAHVFELGGNARMLSIDELADVFDHIEQILNDLRLLASNGTMGMDGVLSMVNPRFTARIFVDRILLGTRADPPAEREAIYDQLHQAHTDHTEREMFNLSDDEGLVAPALARLPASNLR